MTTSVHGFRCAACRRAALHPWLHSAAPLEPRNPDLHAAPWGVGRAGQSTSRELIACRPQPRRNRHTLPRFQGDHLVFAPTGRRVVATGGAMAAAQPPDAKPVGSDPPYSHLAPEGRGRRTKRRVGVPSAALGLGWVGLPPRGGNRHVSATGGTAGLKSALGPPGPVKGEWRLNTGCKPAAPAIQGRGIADRGRPRTGPTSGGNRQRSRVFGPVLRSTRSEASGATAELFPAVRTPTRAHAAPAWRPSADPARSTTTRRRRPARGARIP